MKITALTILDAMRNALLVNGGDNEQHIDAVDKAQEDLVNLIDWSETALDCISASKYPNTHAELTAAIALVNGGAA